MESPRRQGFALGWMLSKCVGGENSVIEYLNKYHILGRPTRVRKKA